MAVYAVALVLTSAALWFRPALAETTATYHFDDQTIHDGWTLKVDSGAELGVFKNVLTGPADVTWATSADLTPTLPEHQNQLGSLYRLTISGVTTLDTSVYRIGVALPDSPSLWQRSIWLYDLSTKTWTKLPSKFNTKTGKWQAGFAVTDAYLTVLEDRTAEEGIASWYCKLHCSARYPKLHGTSNDFPIGSYVNVTSTETGKSVTVKIISRWGQPPGRVIDLSWAAYASLKTKNAGLTRVRLQPPSASSAPATTVVTVSNESLPNLKPVAATATLAPTVSASSYSVIDVGTGQALAAINSADVRPIASLTKLMTAMVFLDTKPQLNSIVTYRKSDITPYAYLRVKVGDTFSLKDAALSMLVGSANNAAAMLSRVTGLSRAKFIAAMNVKAKGWGLTDTRFVDVSGLDPRNVSSAADVAVIANHAFHDYPLIRQATITKSYTFTTKNTKISHTIKTTDALLAKNNGLTITGGKTGFLDEAKYTYVLRTKNAQGAQILVTLLGAPSAKDRFADATKLSTWAWTTYQWL